MRNLILLALLTVLLPGCLLSRKTQNEPLHGAALAQLVPGRTTAKEAVALLGAPTEVVQLGKRTAYRYDHARTKDAGLVLILVNFYNSDTRADRAWVFFDENDVLTHFAASLHADQASWAMPWQSVRSQ
jgi:hypothetical protein